MTNYGTDVSWFPDLDPNLTLTSGSTTLLQALWRRLMTPRGTFAWDPEYGLDVRGLVNETLSPNTIGAWQRQIAAECEKDERVLSASCVLTQVSPTQVTLALSVVGSAGPFTAVLGVTSVGLAILQAPS